MMSKRHQDSKYENFQSCTSSNYMILPTGLEDKFSNRECIVPDNRAYVEKPIANHPTKSKTFSRSKKKSKQFKGELQTNYNYNYNYNESLKYGPTSPIPSTKQTISFDDNRFEKQTGESFYIDIDEVEVPKQSEILSVPLSPTRLPYYITSGKLVDIKRDQEIQPQEIQPQPMEPQEEYMDMETYYQTKITMNDPKESKAYDKWPDIIPPMRKTITYKAVHSHIHSILHKEYHNMVPDVPKRVESLRHKGRHPCSGTRKEIERETSGYDIPKFDVTVDQINERKEGIKTFKKTPNNPPKDKFSHSEKILNANDTMNRTSPQNIFYHVHEIIPPFVNTTKKQSNTIPRNLHDLPRATSPIIQKQELIPNEQTKITPKVQKQKSTPQPPPPKPRPNTRKVLSQENVEEDRKPTRLVKNQMGRANSTKLPPPIKNRPKISKDDGSLPNEVMYDKSIAGEKKEIKKITQDLEKHLKQMNILDSIAPKSHFKQLNLYEDSPAKVVGIKNSTSPIDSSNHYLRL